VECDITFYFIGQHLENFLPFPHTLEIVIRDSDIVSLYHLSKDSPYSILKGHRESERKTSRKTWWYFKGFVSLWIALKLCSFSDSSIKRSEHMSKCL
jgi:hypothetical protein